MDASAPHPNSNSSAPRAPQIRAVLVCDLVDSTALVERLGDAPAADLMRRHDRAARDLLHQHGGREIDKTDGFLLLFERPVQAVGFALGYQRALRTLGEQVRQPLSARVGIHVGEVVLWDNAAHDIADGAKPVEVEGLAKPVAARLMMLARPGQILLSEMARTLAQRAHGELEYDDRLRWVAHGRYRVKGVSTPITVHEVGESGLAPLVAPASSTKAQRELPLWRRPAVLALEVGMILAAIGIPAYLALRPQPAIAFAERDWVVLGDLQNQTSRPDLSDSLDTALRVGLAQSRYVNVIPDLQLRDALKRMEQKPEVQVDRSIGAQLAAREGARALILPTLTEVGSNVRLSIEVVEPSSAVTVYSDSASGQGVDSILPSADALLEKLRQRLGESLDSIEQTSAPLEKITTANLDALRTFSLAERELGRGQLRDGVLMIEQALKLDPEFAMAWGRLGILQLQALGDRAAASTSLQNALRSREKLSLREQLQLDGVVAMAFGSVAEAVEKWSVSAKLYPDSPPSHQNLGQALLWHARDPAASAPHFETAARSAHPLRGYAWLSLALAHTEQGDIDAARTAVAQGRALGVWAPHFEDVLPDLAARDYDAVEARLAAAPATLPPPLLLERNLRAVAVQVDQGHLAAAIELLSEFSRSEATASIPTSRRVKLTMAMIALQVELNQREGALATLRELIQAESQRALEGGDAADDAPLMYLAYASLFAQRLGDSSLATQALDAARRADRPDHYLVEYRLWATAECVLRPQERQRACLDRLIDGHEPFLTRDARWRVLQALGESAAAEKDATWLAQHRGVAVGELEGLPFQTANLIAARRAAISLQAPAATQ